MLNIKMSILRPKNIKIRHVDETSQDIQLSKPMPYSNGQGYSVNFKYNGKKVYIQTPRMKNLFGLSVYKDEKTDKPKSITITLQFASDSDKINRVDNFQKTLLKFDNLIMATANKNHKTWFNYPRTLPPDALKALYKKTLYHKTLPEGGIDHGVPPSFKLKIPYYNEKFNFTLLDENNKPMEFDLEYLQEKIVDKCYIKCIFNPVIWIRKDKNFGVTYNVVALQIIENHDKDNYKKNKKNSKSDSSDNPNKIENYFGKTKKNDSDSDSEDEDDFSNM
jgi:hypothetical protein